MKGCDKSEPAEKNEPLVKGISGPMGGRPKKMVNPEKVKATLKVLRTK
jgi:hypothetical protein